MKYKSEDLKLGKIPKGKGRKANSPLVRAVKVQADKTKFDVSKERQADRKLTRAVHEEAVLQNVKLNDHQKAVLALLAGQQKPLSLIDLTSKATDANRQNLTSSIQLLQKLGLITVTPDKTMQVSEKGKQQMQDENMTDATGQLTPDGQKYQNMFKQAQTDVQAAGGGAATAMGGMGGGFGGGGGDMGIPMGGEMGGFEMPPEGEEGLPGEPGAESNTELPVGNAPGAGEPAPEEGTPAQKMMKAKPVGESLKLIRLLVDKLDFDTKMEKLKVK